MMQKIWKVPEPAFPPAQHCEGDRALGVLTGWATLEAWEDMTSSNVWGAVKAGLEARYP